MSGDKKRKVILVVEDNQSIVNLIFTLIKSVHEDFEIKKLVADNLEEAHKKSSEHCSEIDVVLLDGNLGKRGKDGEKILETLPIVTTLTEKRKAGNFKGVVISISTDDYFNQDLKNAGCDHSFRKHGELTTMILNKKLFELKRKD